MLQASILDCETFDPFAFTEDFCRASAVDVDGREIVQTFVISAVIVMLDEVADLGFEIVWNIIVLQQDAVFERLMPTLDLALRLRMIWRAAHMIWCIGKTPMQTFVEALPLAREKTSQVRELVERPAA